MSGFHNSIIKTLKGKNFSSKGKIEKYNNDGTGTIIVMGRPFRVVKIIGKDANSSSKRTNSGEGILKRFQSIVFLVENSESLLGFPHFIALKRSFFNVNEVVIAHREPEVLNRIKDKNIVRVFHCEVTRSDGRLGVTVAMEYCSSSLERRLRQETRMSESEIVQVLIAITSAVGYLHSQQPPIAHRNICPENILIQSNLVGAMAYQLCNFHGATSEAYQCENSEEVKMAFEDFERYTTPGFRAPEMEDPATHNRIDERVDLWSIGVLLYYMMYLQLPFGEMGLRMKRQFKLSYPPGTEMWYTGSLHVVLQHLLVPNPDERWDIFALTNFLRFDNDISKHLGTFFFTATEWPDGWEEQEVKVVNRPSTQKASPIRVKPNQQAVAATGNSTEVRMGHEVSSSLRPGEIDAEALAALGLDADTDDPDMLAYREMLIREQEEAWEMATAARQKADSGATTTTVVEEEPKHDNYQRQHSEGQKTKKNDTFFDDLFETTQAPSLEVPITSAFPVATPQACGELPNAQVLETSMAVHDKKNWGNSFFDDGWETGAPTTNVVLGMPDGVGGVCGTSEAGMMRPLYAQHGQQQQQGPLPVEGALPPPQQVTFDFTKENFSPPPVSTMAQPTKTNKKDPFEDLFR